MVYLADWYYALKHGKQLTNIKWNFDHYGPYVADVFNIAKNDRKLIIEQGFSQYGSPKQTIKINENYINSFHVGRLDVEVTEVLDKVIEDTRSMYWDDFISYIYSSYPIKNSRRFEKLNLKKLAAKCKDEGIEY